MVNADSDFHITLVEDGLLPDERQYLIDEQRKYKEERSMVSENGKDVRDKSRTSRTTTQLRLHRVPCGGIAVCGATRGDLIRPRILA